MSELIDLLKASGPLLIFGGFVFLGKHIVAYIFKDLLEIRKSESQKEIEKYKIELRTEEERNRKQFEWDKSKYEFELKKNLDLAINKYQIDTIKINRVLPLIERINQTLEYQASLFSEYFHIIINKGNPEYLNDKKIKSHTEFMELFGQISFYLPAEIKGILDHLLLIVSNKLLDGYGFYKSYNLIKKDEDRVSFLTDCRKYYFKYSNAYFDLISLYAQEFDIRYQNDEKIIAILKTYNISPTNFKLTDDSINVNDIERLVLLSNYRN